MSCMPRVNGNEILHVVQDIDIERDFRAMVKRSLPPMSRHGTCRHHRSARYALPGFTASRRP